MCPMPNHYCPKHAEHEAEYLASRAKWNNRERNKAKVHQYNTVIRNRNDNKREQYNFYRTRQWSHLRQQVRERDHYVCQYCKAIGKFTPDCKTVDHIVPIEVDANIKANVDNLVVSCRRCHYRKTEWERKYYGTGNGNKLKNVKPITNINEVMLLMNGRSNYDKKD
ncbi:HNH endonuclease [Pediococcus acidilactici]|uniref:HNH endonuclease n=1 Tax=Pediococcus acidilactici TaxID=1254 RepID=UPI00232E85C6|nr:HNH endonuclease [Pediococcus acidilactici]MDB8867668.1 HNH endonuclease [Pediococcus acidilactici]